MFVMLYILFDVFVSFSVEFTATTFAIVPFVITLHIIVSTNSEYAGISPIVHMPVVRLYVPFVAFIPFSVTFKSLLNFSVTFTFVASQGPLL